MSDAAAMDAAGPERTATSTTDAVRAAEATGPETPGPAESPRTAAYTADAVRAAEAPLIAEGRPLMRWAAAALAEVVAVELDAAPGPVLVLAGAGDNGGDALYAAASLAQRAERIDVVLVRDRVHRGALDAATGAGARVVAASDVCSRLSDYALVLDGILGIGRLADRRLRGSARAIAESLLALPERPRIVAVDLPSGLDPDDGTADATVLPADVTVTFGALKAGLVRGRGPELAGRVHLVDLGLEPALQRARPAVTTPIPVVRVPARHRL